MAYVPISGSVAERIYNNIEAKKDAEYKNIRQFWPEEIQGLQYTNDELMQKLIDYAWGEQLDIRDRIPDSWKHRIHSVYVAVYVGGQVYNIGVRSTKLTSDSRVLPPDTHLIRYDSRKGDIANELVELLTKFGELANEIEERYIKVRADIKKLLESTRSLNQAVKQVPELRYYLDATLKERLDRKTDAKTREDKEEVQVDRGLIAAVAVAGTLSGA